jgi:hypothetical protein
MDFKEIWAVEGVFSVGHGKPGTLHITGSWTEEEHAAKTVAIKTIVTTIDPTIEVVVSRGPMPFFQSVTI